MPELPNVQINEEALHIVTSKSITDTFEELYVHDIPPEQPFTDDSKTFTFQVRPRSLGSYRPSECELLVPVKIVKQDDTNFTDPNDAKNGAGVHARLKNMIGLSLIRQVEVKPGGNEEICYMDPQNTALIEQMRYYFQYNKDEKKDPNMFWDKLSSYHLDQAEDPTLCGMADDYDVGNKAHHAARMLEIMTHNRWHLLRLKFPDPFHENSSYLPGICQFEMVVHLQSNAYSCIQRTGANNGLGPPSATAANQPKYVVDSKNLKMRIYYKLLKEEDRAAFRASFLSKTNIKFECFPSFKVVKSLPLEQTYQIEGMRLEQLDKLNGKIPEKFIFGFVNAEDFEAGGTLNRQPFAFQDFRVDRVQLYIGDRPIFRNGGIRWQTSMRTNKLLWDMQADAVASKEDSENRRAPTGDIILQLHHRKHFAYVSLNPNWTSGISEVTKEIEQVFKADIHFVAGVLPENTPRICFVVMAMKQDFIVLENTINNQWQKAQEYKVPREAKIILANHRTGEN